MRFLSLCSCLVLLGLSAQPSGAADASPARPARAKAQGPILIYGDSLSAAYGLAVHEGWPSLLQQRLAAQGYAHRVENRSLSGETTVGGRQRLARVLEQTRPQVMVLALGANDGLRGLPIAQAEANLSAMIQQATSQGVQVLLVGVELPPNFGPTQRAQFARMYQSLSKAQQVRLLPSLLGPLALDEANFQADRIHPTAATQPKLLDRIWPALKPML